MIMSETDTPNAKRVSAHQIMKHTQWAKNHHLKLKTNIISSHFNRHFLRTALLITYYSLYFFPLVICTVGRLAGCLKCNKIKTNDTDNHLALWQQHHPPAASETI